MRDGKKTEKSRRFRLGELFGTKRFRRGSYAMILSAAAAAIVLVINLIAGQLPASVKNIDLSAQKLYTIGAETEAFLERLAEDVTIYMVAQEGAESDVLTKMLDRYQDCSGHIKVEQVDPVLSPSFASAYGVEGLADNSLVVESQKRYKVINDTDIFLVNYDMSSYYMTGSYSASQSYDGEGQLTGAIAYVLSDELPVVYALTGHGESPLNDHVKDLIEKSNMELRELSLLAEGGIPEDAAGLIVNGASFDLSEDEAQMVLDYLENGGKAVILTAYTDEMLTNLNKILENYGMTLERGIVLEGNAGNYYGTPLTILPEIRSHSVTEQILSDRTPAMLVNMVPLTEKKEIRDTLTVTPLMETSDSAFVKQVEGGRLNSYERDGKEAEAVYAGALLAEETVGEETAGLLVISSSHLLNQEISQQFHVCNEELFISGLSYLCKGQSVNTGIGAKSMDLVYLSPSAAQVNLLAGIYVIIIPVGVLLLGFGVWLMRRKK